MGNKSYFPNLDGLRTIACFMVFSFHALGMGHNRLGIRNEYLEKFLLTFLNGKTGVSIFFVLSGFLITLIILSEIKQNGEFNLGHFYIRRILRIWPLYFLVLLIVFVLLPVIDHFLSISHSTADTRPAYYFTFLSNFDVLRIFENGGTDFLPSTITWSVAIEEQFYLFWALPFFFIQPAYYKHVFIFIIGVAFCFRLIHYNQVYQLYFHSFSVAFDLAVGGAAAYLCFTDSRIKKMIAEMRDPERLLVIAAGIIVMYLNSWLHSPWINLVLGFAQVFFFAFIIMDQCFNRSEALKFSRSKLLSRIGKYTYGIYMLHPLVLLLINLVMVRIMHKNVDSPFTVAACFFAGLPLTIWLAAGSYNYIEKRFLVLKKKFSFVTIIPIKG
ncbi:MAG: acyltransferase [Chitinophagaceae bacterium]|nr:acyltransferase [Chitinophagaceae bacterium]